MLEQAVQDPVWEVMMLAFHMLNQNARAKVFPHTRRNGIGTLLMFVVRSLFSRPGRLQATLRQLADDGRVPAWLARSDDPLGFLVHEGGAASVIDAAYRYARHEAGRTWSCSALAMRTTWSRTSARSWRRRCRRPTLPG
jgi:hypothetical protein